MNIMKARPKRLSWVAPELAGLLLLALLSMSSCGGGENEPQPTQPASGAAAPAATPAASSPPDEAPLPPPAAESDLPEGVRAIVEQSFLGDLDKMVERRLIRVGVSFNRTHYFVDKGVQRGAAYEYGKLFEDVLNKQHNTGNLRVNVFFVPLPRDMLLPSLADGKVDMVMAQLTVTPERLKLVDFTKPFRTNVSEVVVTGPGAPTLATLEDLAGKSVFVRKTSSYYQSLLALNQKLKAAGRAPVAVEEAPENLEDDDLLEMVSAGLIPIIVVDDYLAEFWNKVFTNLTVHEGLALRTGGNIAVAIRKNSPELAAELNAFIDKNGLDTTFGRVLSKRYLQNTGYVKSATSEAERKKFRELVALFQKYGEQYQLDYLLMAAQGYQESQLKQDAKSQVGAVGVMQVMPATGKELNVGDIRELEPNIHAGVKYIRFMMDRYYKDEPMSGLDKALFTFASYNAGPGRIRQLRREAAKRGLDPNVWFGNVERIASERIGRETVTYVSNIYKYYVAYKLVTEGNKRRAAAKQALKPAQAK
jgi:membrane-bound lytic murein transglycosylase MltF